MTKQEFIEEAKRRGKSKEETRAKYEELDAAGKFDDSAVVTESPSQPAAPAGGGNAYDKYGVAGALFPARASAEEKAKPGFGGDLSKAISTIGDVVTLAPRGVSAAATGLGTLAGGGNLDQAKLAAIRDLSKFKSEEKGSLGFAQNVALDPSTYVPAGKAVQGGKAVGKLASLGKAALFAGKEGLKQGAASSAYQQASTGKIDPAQFAAETTIGAGSGALIAGAPGLAKDAIAKGMKSLGGEGTVAKRATIGLLESGLKGAGQKLEDAAARIQGTKIKINAPEQRMGATNENFVKYDLMGNAEEVHEKAKTKLSDLSAELGEKIKDASDNPENNVNMSQVLARARERMTGSKTTAVEANQINKAWKDIAEEMEAPYLDENGVPTPVNLLEAQLLKRYVGKNGDWLANPGGGMKPDMSATQKSMIYNSIYDELKNELENKGGEGIKELNKAMSEIIPLERAAGRNILLANRKNPIAFDDYLGGLAVAGSAASGNFLPAAVAGLNVASKSPTIAKGLLGLGRKLKGAGEGVATVGEALDTDVKDIAGYGKSKLSGLSTLGKRGILGNERGAVGAVVDPQVKSDNFKGFFGDWEKSPSKASKVVDESGVPLKVWHGSDADFNVFESKYMGKNGTSQGQGFYLTPDRDLALGYGKDPRAFYVDIKKPLNRQKKTITKPQLMRIIDTIDKDVAKKDGSEILSNYGDVNYDGRYKVLNEAVSIEYDGGVSDIDLYGSLVNSTGDQEAVASAFKKITGHDGIISENGKEIVPLSSTQIKSATGNSGKFDPKNPDIRGSGAVPTMAATAGLSGAGLTAIAALGAKKRKEEERKQKAGGR